MKNYRFILVFFMTFFCVSGGVRAGNDWVDVCSNFVKDMGAIPYIDLSIVAAHDVLNTGLEPLNLEVQKDEVLLSDYNLNEIIELRESAGDKKVYQFESGEKLIILAQGHADVVSDIFSYLSDDVDNHVIFKNLNKLEREEINRQIVGENKDAIDLEVQASKVSIADVQCEHSTKLKDVKFLALLYLKSVPIDYIHYSFVNNSLVKGVLIGSLVDGREVWEGSYRINSKYYKIIFSGVDGGVKNLGKKLLLSFKFY